MNAHIAMMIKTAACQVTLSMSKQKDLQLFWKQIVIDNLVKMSHNHNSDALATKQVKSACLETNHLRCKHNTTRNIAQNRECIPNQPPIHQVSIQSTPTMAFSLGLGICFFV
jgi:hypothetical protein